MTARSRYERRDRAKALLRITHTVYACVRKVWVCTYACRILDLRTELKTSSQYTLRVFLNSDFIKQIIPLLCYTNV